MNKRKTSKDFMAKKTHEDNFPEQSLQVHVFDPWF